MGIDLDTIQKMWEQDSKIDPDNLHTESLNIPILHSSNVWLQGEGLVVFSDQGTVDTFKHLIN